jgi:tRNA uridine 5-carbamoylmethylation protein Kti12
MSLLNEIKELKKLFLEVSQYEKDIIEAVIEEGVDDPGILKCVFMAGGPGSGKSYKAAELFGVGKGMITSFSAGGLKIVNSDTAFEVALERNGIDAGEIARMKKENPELYGRVISNPDSIRNRAKAITAKKLNFYEEGRLGLLIDGTGDDFSKIKIKKDHAEDLGYDCYMVFVNTSLPVALERNRKRKRVLPDDDVKQIWNDCQNNLGKFQTLFGSQNFRIVDNTVTGNKTPDDIQSSINAFMKKPIINRIGAEWIKAAREFKKRN